MHRSIGARARFMAAACGAALLYAATPAFAQDAEESASDARDVILVTAQRREQTIEDVAASVSALGAADLEERGVLRLDDIASSFPNVYINPGNGVRTTVITVRGIASSPNNPGVEQSVGVFVDGVHMSRPTTINTNVYDLERIEVIRGPQGALYGRNTIAGALNFITAGPGDVPSFEGAINAGDYGLIAMYAAGDVVLSPRARARVSVSSQQRDGYVLNTFTGAEYDDFDELGGRVTFVYEPTDALTLTWRADGATNDTRAGSADVLNNGALAGTPLADADPFDRMVVADFDNYQTRDLWGTSLQADFEFGPGVLTSVTAYRDFEWLNAQDNDYTILNQLRSGISEDYGMFSQELRYTSDLGNGMDYIVGAYYSHETLDTISNAVLGTDLGIYPTDVDANIYGDLTTTSFAVFGQGSLHLTDQLSISAALRYSVDDKEVTHSQVGDPFALFGATFGPRTLSRSDEEVTPSFSLNFEPTPDTLLYASYGRGYKSGGYNVFSITPTSDAIFEPEFVDSFELGAKGVFGDGALYLAGSVFWLDYTDLQVNQLITVNGVPTFTTSNAASAESWGVELEGRWDPTAALSFSAAYGYLDATFENFENATASGDDYSGNVLPQAPEHTFSLNGDFRTPVFANTELVLHGDATYRSELFFGPENNPDLAQDAVTLFNARAGLAFDDDRWSVMVWGRNLTDEDYAVSRSAGAIIPGQLIQSLGAPRTWGVELRGRF